MRARLCFVALALTSIVASGCALSIREGYFGCHDGTDCPPGWFCRVDRCYSTPDGALASSDAGSDANVDAARDAAVVPGTDANTDAAAPSDAADVGVLDAPMSIDSGSDAGGSDGIDAAGVDAGNDAGHDASTWTPSGSYTLAPNLSYVCAEYDFNVLALTLADDGATLSVTDPTRDFACSLTGGTARVTGSIDVSCTVSMACSATYHLTGSFTSDDTWSGTLTATFSGTGASCGAAPDTCMNRTWSGVVGSR